MEASLTVNIRTCILKICTYNLKSRLRQCLLSSRGKVLFLLLECCPSGVKSSRSRMSVILAMHVASSRSSLELLLHHSLGQAKKVIYLCEIVFVCEKERGKTTKKLSGVFSKTTKHLAKQLKNTQVSGLCS